MIRRLASSEAIASKAASSLKRLNSAVISPLRRLISEICTESPN
ncbi:Uncharacterised protein [Vibrio cholerae]|nr:Uncharacterised protein [Vibrio cholerae]CSB69672.1 Uncharacterised protein [Vibrio cholerae]CSI85235.1 Uncharacterised protein [Vibrio cholerae]